MQSKIKEYIKRWLKRGYEKEIPDECPQELENLGIVPSYRLIAQCILKNDHQCKSLGFSEKKSKWYNHYKKIEIQNRIKN